MCESLISEPIINFINFTLFLKLQAKKEINFNIVEPNIFLSIFIVYTLSLVHNWWAWALWAIGIWIYTKKVEQKVCFYLCSKQILTMQELTRNKKFKPIKFQITKINKNIVSCKLQGDLRWLQLTLHFLGLERYFIYLRVRGSKLNRFSTKISFSHFSNFWIDLDESTTIMHLII